MRRQIVALVRRGKSLRAAARRFGVSLCTVQRWVAHAGGERLDRVSFEARPAGRSSNRTAPAIEDRVLAIRKRLAEQSDLGEHGAEAVRRELLRLKAKGIPSARTIGRILLRRGALDGRHRVRRPPPPPGWYLPDVAAGRAELDSFDAVEGLVLRGGGTGGRRPVGVEVLNGVSLHGGLVASWPGTGVTAVNTQASLLAHWRASGLPAYVQFDNAPTFAGSPAKHDTFGRVIRICLSLGVTPVFAPPRETGFQAAIESYNGRWQAKVWARFHHPSLRSLIGRSDRYVAAARLRSAVRIESAPPRRPFPKGWSWDPRRPLAGRVVYLRRTDDKGRVRLLGHTFDVDAKWPGRLVRAEIDFDAKQARFYALRRREPGWQPLLKKLAYRPQTRAFRE